MNVTLCDKVLIGDVPRYEFKDKQEAINLVHHWLENKDFDKSVFVCFQNWRGLPIKELRNEQRSFLVTHCWDEIACMFEDYLEDINDDDFDFAIFEYGTYQEAFKYCIDLKESF